MTLQQLGQNIPTPIRECKRSYCNNWVRISPPPYESARDHTATTGSEYPHPHTRVQEIILQQLGQNIPTPIGECKRSYCNNWVRTSPPPYESARDHTATTGSEYPHPHTRVQEIILQQLGQNIPPTPPVLPLWLFCIGVKKAYEHDTAASVNVTFKLDRHVAIWSLDQSTHTHQYSKVCKQTLNFVF